MRKQPDYYHIDSYIRLLVSTMNVYGYRTYASCQGHGFPVDRMAPYIAFRCPLSTATALEQCLRRDSESTSPLLRWGWTVRASFNSEFQLCFDLRPEKAHCWYDRYWRRSLISDFSGIAFLLKTLIQPTP